MSDSCSKSTSSPLPSGWRRRTAASIRSSTVTSMPTFGAVSSTSWTGSRSSLWAEVRGRGWRSDARPMTWGRATLWLADWGFLIGCSVFVCCCCCCNFQIRDCDICCCCSSSYSSSFSSSTQQYLEDVYIVTVCQDYNYEILIIIDL